MSSKRYQGTLKTWKGDRGFGFIRPHGGGKDVFLHITAVRAAPRPPQVGDQLSYEIALQADGKVRAVNAAIAGVSQSPGTVRSPQTQATPTTAQNASTLVVVAVSAVGAVGLLLGLGGLLHDRWQRDLAARSAPADVPSVTTSPTPAAASRPLSPSPAPPVAIAAPPSPPPAVPAAVTDPAPVPVVSAPAAPATPAPVDQAPAAPADSAPTFDPNDCAIKGNISVESKKKFYHLPGMRDYDITEIDIMKGERWFCSEADAQASGWVKAPTP